MSQDDTHLRTLAPDPLDKADAIDASRHLDVGEDRIDVPDRLQHLQRLISGIGFDDR